MSEILSYVLANVKELAEIVQSGGEFEDVYHRLNANGFFLSADMKEKVSRIIQEFMSSTALNFLTTNIEHFKWLLENGKGDFVAHYVKSNGLVGVDNQFWRAEDIGLGLVLARVSNHKVVEYTQLLSSALKSTSKTYYLEHCVQYVSQAPILLPQIKSWLSLILTGYSPDKVHFYSQIPKNWDGKWTPYIYIPDPEPHYTLLVEVARADELGYSPYTDYSVAWGGVDFITRLPIVAGV